MTVDRQREPNLLLDTCWSPTKKMSSNKLKKPGGCFWIGTGSQAWYLAKKGVVNGAVATFWVFEETHLVSYSVNLILVAAVTQIIVDSPGSILFNKSSRFFHPLLVNIPQYHDCVKNCKLLSHEPSNPTACPCYQHHLTRYVFFLHWHKKADERLHIVPDGQEKHLNCFQEEIHNGARKKQNTLLRYIFGHQGELK